MADTLSASTSPTNLLDRLDRLGRRLEPRTTRGFLFLAAEAPFPARPDPLCAMVGRARASQGMDLQGRRPD